LGARRKYRRKAGGHRRAHQPLGYFARICVQRVDGFAEFRPDRPVRIADRKATSLEKLLGRSVKEREVAPWIAKHLGELLGLEMTEATKRELLEKLEHAEQAAVLSA